MSYYDSGCLIVPYRPSFSIRIFLIPPLLLLGVFISPPLLELVWLPALRGLWILFSQIYPVFLSLPYGVGLSSLGTVPPFSVLFCGELQTLSFAPQLITPDHLVRISRASFSYGR